jgi:glucosamine--fructose-6-phosphate aminotransferase (isomerizing)
VIKKLALRFADKQHALFLGRGALHADRARRRAQAQGNSYIHAEAYAAGELKHGPLALVDADMPVITMAPNNDLLEKLKST